MTTKQRTELSEAIALLQYHNQWIRGSKVSLVCPVKLGMALDLVTKTLPKLLERLDTYERGWNAEIIKRK